MREFSHSTNWGFLVGSKFFDRVMSSLVLHWCVLVFINTICVCLALILGCLPSHQSESLVPPQTSMPNPLGSSPWWCRDSYLWRYNSPRRHGHLNVANISTWKIVSQPFISIDLRICRIILMNKIFLNRLMYVKLTITPNLWMFPLAFIVLLFEVLPICRHKPCHLRKYSFSFRYNIRTKSWKWKF